MFWITPCQVWFRNLAARTRTTFFYLKRKKRELPGFHNVRSLDCVHSEIRGGRCKSRELTQKYVFLGNFQRKLPRSTFFGRRSAAQGAAKIWKTLFVGSDRIHRKAIAPENFTQWKFSRVVRGSERFFIGQQVCWPKKKSRGMFFLFIVPHQRVEGCKPYPLRGCTPPP